MTLYRITNWEALFETYETKKLTHLKWVPVPNKHDGLGFRRVAAQKNRCELFAAWNLILQIASKGRKTTDRGMLQRDGRPLTPEDMAMMTGFPVGIFEEALKFFSSPQMGWLEAVVQEPTDKTAEAPVRTADSRTEACASPAEGNGREGIELNGTEGNGSDRPDRFSKARTALIWLNEHAGRHYRETADNLSLINTRLEDVGNDLEGVKVMILRQIKCWKGNPKMEPFLRPETLFAKKHFGGYYDERLLPVKNGHTPEANQIQETISVKNL